MEKYVKDILKICEGYENGEYYEELSRKFNLDSRTIKKIIKKNNTIRKHIKNRNKYFVDETYFDCITEEKLWLLGLLAADGWVKNESGFGIAQSGPYGKEMIEYIKNILKYTGPVYSTKTDCEVSYSLYITSRKIVEKLAEFNIINKKSLIYKLPNISNEQIKSFIRGYIDGDGSIGVYDNGKGYHSLVISFVGTKEFVDSVSNILPVKSSNILNKKTTNCWEIRWYGKKAYEFGSWLFSNKNLFVSKKYTIFANHKEPTYKKELYDEKKKIVKKLLNEGKTISDIANTVKIPFQTIYKWKKKF